jgi:hypothetical protein
MSKFCKSILEHGDNSQLHCIVDLKTAENRCPMFLPDTEGGSCEVIDMLISSIMIIISQYIHVSKHHIIYCK